MATIFSKKPILRTTLIFLALVAVLSLAFVFRPKDPLYALADLARQDAPDRPLLTTTIVSASTDTTGATAAVATASSLDESLEKAIAKITATEAFSTYTHFRLDVAYGPDATSPDTLLAALPAVGEYTYFATTTTRARQIPAEPAQLTPQQIRDVTYKAAIFLANQVGEDGRFAYGFDLRTYTPSEDYSMGAHSASISALLKSYRLIGDAYLLEKSKLAIEYLIGFTVTSNEHPDRAYVQNAYTTAIDLSDTSLAAIALADYQDITGSTEHAELLRYLVNGIESAYQAASCTYYAHELELDLTPRSAAVASYYDTQATTATARAAKTLGDGAFLAAAARNLDKMGKGEGLPSAALYWLAQAITAHNSIAGADATHYEAPTLNYRTAEQVYADFTEPWVAMFSAMPDYALHSFIDSNNHTSIAFHQSALTSLLGLQAL